MAKTIIRKSSSSEPGSEQEQVTPKSKFVTAENGDLAKEIYSQIVREELSSIRTLSTEQIDAAITAACRKTERIVKGFVDYFGDI